MALQIKMNMAENGVQALCSMDGMPLDSTTLHARDVTAFVGMMKQNSGETNNSDGHTTDAKTNDKLADLPNPTMLVSLASSRIVSTSANGATALVSGQSAEYADSVQRMQDTAPNAQMAALLASMNGTLQASVMQNSATPVAAKTENVTAPHFTAKEIDAMVTMLVDRIAVTDVKAHMVTVEISLADTALRGTTVHLTRSLDGLLTVNVITNNAATFQTLVGAQIDLRMKLESLDSGMVRVDIFHNPQDQERKQNRRSAMYQEYVGDDDHA